MIKLKPGSVILAIVILAILAALGVTTGSKVRPATPQKGNNDQNLTIALQWSDKIPPESVTIVYHVMGEHREFQPTLDQLEHMHIGNPWFYKWVKVVTSYDGSPAWVEVRVPYAYTAYCSMRTALAASAFNEGRGKGYAKCQYPPPARS